MPWYVFAGALIMAVFFFWWGSPSRGTVPPTYGKDRIRPSMSDRLLFAGLIFLFYFAFFGFCARFLDLC